MKKIFSLFAVVTAVLVFSGCANQKAAETPAQKETPAEVKKETGNVISSIKDAMGLGKKMKCTYSVGTGDSKFESTAFIDGKKYKSSSMIAGKLAYAYFDGEVMYSWMEDTKTGTKMTMACINDLKTSLPENQPANIPSVAKSPEEQFDNAVNANCVPAETADFSVPTDVTFTDQCEMMKKTLDSMKNIKLPGNVKMPTDLPKL